MLTELLQSNSAIKILFIALGFLVIQFFIIRPRRKEEQTRNNFLKTLKIGMKVITIGGVYGKVIKIDHATVVLQVDPKGFSFTIKKHAILEEAPQTIIKSKK